ncbi:MAG: hypothetical protein BWY78_00465 [Alphaproteobacteria bacterium ADurb.Bin438]|nr:MAG: hypothetical protein BWY78_00465 [Alphaproteobacteria bacterium ADurb.Bin438]
MSKIDVQDQNVIVKKIWTRILVDELKSREGVSCTEIAPYDCLETKISGPAIIITVID